jgi:hypothetical protein
MSISDFIELLPIPRCRKTGFAMLVEIDASHNPGHRRYACYLQHARLHQDAVSESVVSSLTQYSCGMTNCLFYSGEFA